MIYVESGNILNTDCNIICQQVNCKGVMGAGLALQIRNKYPEVYRAYASCYDSFHLGQTQFVKTLSDDRFVANIFGQNGYGRTGVHTDYAALRTGLEEVRTLAEQRNLSVAIPYGIGCGLAGGDWAIVTEIIQNVFNGSSVLVKIIRR